MAVVRKYWFVILIGVMAAAVLAAVIYQLQADKEDESDTSNMSQIFPLRQEAPQFELESKDGGKVSLAENDGKVRVVYFFFSNCPDVCPPTTYMLSMTQNELMDRDVFEDNVAFYSISFDPVKDTPERLQEFSAYYEPNEGNWFFLRGDDEQSVAELANDYGIMVMKDAEGNFGHANLIALVDQEGYIRKYYNANDVEDVTFELIADEIELLINE